MTPPAGLYVHLPYCRSRCGYCSFVVTTDESSKDRYLAALERETGLVAAEASGETFDSVYLGGGTPSLLSAPAVASLMSTVARCLTVASDCEVTLEANPEDVTPDMARSWKEAGITRISVGIQSFEDRELAAVGRRHDCARASRALETVLEEGFSTSGDLILGLPDQTAETFGASVDSLLSAGVDHISVYLLESEKSKSIEEDRHANPRRYLSDDAQADLWLEICGTFAENGFRHYEISNWARPGFEARHNLKYWRRTPTLGVGISAHELWRERRRANVSALPAYLSALEGGTRPLALDRPVDPDERAREEIVLGLRLADGIEADRLDRWIRAAGDSTLAGDVAAWEEAGILLRSGGNIAFTERGFLVSNEVLCRFV